MDDVESKVIEWLKSGTDSAKDIVDLPWTLRELRPRTYLAEHPRMPFSLMVVFSEDFVHLLVPLGLETLSMSTEERLKVYHTLLRLNDGVNMMKFTLSGMNDDVYLRVDLDKSTLGKEEFNNALTALLIGLMSAVSELGLEESFAQEVFDRIVGMVVERMQKGASREELMRFLTVKVGMSEKDASALLGQILQAMNSQDSRENVGYF
ncbi:DNA-binding protein [Thermococcus sp.]|uniref:DNA-binding protein n=1 Tax=Thermococcus sp. TaxID=35749 RepID=UPI00260E63F3|nr:DNA-binding protein [Thermococcus sp.]